MTRRSIAIIAGLAVAVAAAIGGTIAVTGLGDEDGVSKPDGSDTIVRLQPQDGTVSCGAGPVPAYIYLDDLETRPSPDDASVSYGVAGFSFLLHYDPEIVRIAQGVDIELNPALSQEDADGDGLARSFFPLVNLDDGAGEVLLGAASLVPTEDVLGDEREEGLDPVAKGEPMLLMTVRFLPVGQGRTELVIDDGTEPAADVLAEIVKPQALDPSGRPYELTLRNTSITVEGGDCPAGPFATPKPGPLPTSTPYVEPTIEILATAAPITPTPAPLVGRSDCPKDWSAFEDSNGRFSLCYPSDIVPRVGQPPREDFGSTLSLTSDAFLLTVYWTAFSPFDSGVLSERCTPVSHWADVQEVALVIAGQEVDGCVGDATDYGHLNADASATLRGTFAEIPLATGDGYVVMFLTEVGSASSIDQQPLSSLVGSLLVGEYEGDGE